MTAQVSQAAADAAAVLDTEPGQRLMEYLVGRYMVAPPQEGADGLTYSRHSGRADVLQHIAVLAATGRAGQQSPARPVLMRIFRSIFGIKG